MSKLDDLINKLCPDGVEYKPLSDKTLFDFHYGKGNKIPEDIGGIYDVYGANGVVSHIDEYNCEDISIIGHIGAVGFINRCKSKCYVTYNGTIADIVDKSKVNTQYFYYVLTTLDLPSYKKGSQPFLSVSDFDKIEIPVPPSEIQNEIVRILDNFTELEEELEEELVARRKQYEYYSDSLLTFDDSVEWSTLGEVSKIKNGSDYKHLPEGNIPVYGSGGIMTYVNTYSFNKPSVLIPRKGSLKNLFYVDVPFWNVDTIFNTDINTELILPKFLFYYLKTQHLEELNMAGGVPSLTQTILNKVKIPLPSKTEQEKIIAILDRFDALTNDITSGLPAEIEARHKQYEYYRDKLLTFKRKGA